MTEHTYTPWKVTGKLKTTVRTWDGLFIAECGPEPMNRAQNDAEFIVRAVNAHDALLAAAEENYVKRHEYGMWIARLEAEKRPGVIGSHTNPIEECTSPGCVKNRAAISQARGEA